MASLARFPALAAFLAGGSATWRDLNIAPGELLSLCEREELSSLVYQRLTESGSTDGWPLDVREALVERARGRAGEELLRAGETRAVLDALGRAGVWPMLIKGTPLAYGWYGTPASRPRDDTDVLIPAAQVETARRVMASLDYVTTVQCSDVFSQFEVQKTDHLGVVHAFDIHWRISAQPAFADVLTYDELLPRTVRVPTLGASAFAPGTVDALLLACVHPVMHHRNVERVLWIYDIHLLAAALAPAELDEFARRAVEKRVAAVCAHGLRLARSTFGTAVPAEIVARLSTPGRAEPSAAYLASDRRWHDELISSIRGLPSFGERARLLRAVLFPGARYMLDAYGLRGKPLGPWLLPALYVHRNLHGAWKVVSGKK